MVRDQAGGGREYIKMLSAHPSKQLVGCWRYADAKHWSERMNAFLVLHPPVLPLVLFSVSLTLPPLAGPPPLHT